MLSQNKFYCLDKAKEIYNTQKSFVIRVKYNLQSQSYVYYINTGIPMYIQSSLSLSCNPDIISFASGALTLMEIFLVQHKHGHRCLHLHTGVYTIMKCRYTYTIHIPTEYNISKERKQESRCVYLLFLLRETLVIFSS